MHLSPSLSLGLTLGPNTSRLTVLTGFICDPSSLSSSSHIYLCLRCQCHTATACLFKFHHIPEQPNTFSLLLLLPQVRSMGIPLYFLSNVTLPIPDESSRCSTDAAFQTCRNVTDYNDCSHASHTYLEVWVCSNHLLFSGEADCTGVWCSAVNSGGRTDTHYLSATACQWSTK